MKSRRYHIIIDLENVEDAKLSDKIFIVNFLKELPPIIDMHVLLGPEIVEGIPANPGVTGFVIIDYSHISVHTFTQYQEALIDIFSCKPYNQEEVIDFTLKKFAAKKEQASIKVVGWN